MAGIQQKRKSPKSFKSRRKAIPVVILKKGQGTFGIIHNQHHGIQLIIKIQNF